MRHLGFGLIVTNYRPIQGSRPIDQTFFGCGSALVEDFQRIAFSHDAPHFFTYFAVTLYQAGRYTKNLHVRRPGSTGDFVDVVYGQDLVSDVYLRRDRAAP